MFNYNLFYLLILMCIPGTLLTIPLLKSTYSIVKQRTPQDIRFPSLIRFIFIAVMQTTVLVVITADVGTYLMPKTGLTAPFLASVADMAPDIHLLIMQLLPVAIVGLSGIIGFFFVYYYIFAPQIDKETLITMRNLRQRMGFWGRVFYGGIVEEVLFRWGLMSMLVFAGIFICGKVDAYVMWSAIILTGLLFGLGHIPGYLSYGCRSTPQLLLGILTLNMLASIIFGWLFWQNGLEAAMMTHALLHIIWHFLDRAKV